MDLNRENMDAFFQTLNTAFTEGMQAGREREMPEDPTVAELAMIVPSTGAASIHAWLGQIPAMRKWVGDRVIQNILSGKLTVVNDDFESTVSVPRNDILDDQYGLYAPLVRVMGANAELLWPKLAIDALVGGVAGLWADGAAFFGTTRKYGAATISNKTTSALAKATFEAAIQAMTSYVGHNGEPMAVAPRYLVVGPKMRSTAWDLVKNTVAIVPQTNVAGAENVGAAAVQNRTQGLCELRVSRRLVGDYDDYWFILGEQAGIKGVAVQKRAEPKLTRMDRDTDENVFMRKEYLYGTDARGASFLTLPHLVYGGIL